MYFPINILISIILDGHTCTVQGGGKGSCVIIFHCKPLMHLVANLTRPISPELPELMKHSLLCDNKNVGGLNIPKVCCPLDPLQGKQESETEQYTESPTTKYEPITDEKR